MGGKKLVKQVRSSNGQTKRVKATLQALGLGRIGKSKVHAIQPSVVGMLKSVRHLVELDEVKGK